MKIIGITGGVGAGKSEVLKLLQKNCNCQIVMADEVAHDLEEKGTECYHKLLALLGEGVLSEDGSINRNKMAAVIFTDKSLLEKVNALMHPAVKEEILRRIDKARHEGFDYFFVEAALLLEDRYDLICDTIWYIYADSETRIRRLMESRGYSREKALDIMGKQLGEEEFRKRTDACISNNGDLGETWVQISKLLEK